MNMNRVAQVLIVFTIALGACQNKVRETPNGMKYEVVSEGDGTRPMKGEIVVFDMVTQDSEDSVWSSTYKRGMPAFVQIQDSAQLDTEDGILQMFRELSKGDSVKVTMSITQFFSEFARSPLPPTVDSTLNVTHFFKIHEFITEDEFPAYQNNLMEKKATAQKSLDEKAITAFLTKENISAQRDTSGIHFVIHKSEGKQKPTPENCVEVNYEGKLLESGQTFDKNDGISFPLNQVIRGWQVGIPLLGLGDSATLYIPSDMAYGPRGVPGAIPPNSILVFNVKLTGIGEGFDPATRSCK